MENQEAMAIVEPAATRVRDPLTGRSIWLAQLISNAVMTEENLHITTKFSLQHGDTERQKIRNSLILQLQKLGWKGEITFQQSQIKDKPEVKKPPSQEPTVKGMQGGGMGPHGGPIQKLPIPGVKNIVAVASGKGGVGKSTIAVNLAIALKKMGLKVGLLDADVYGPSLPTMMRVQGAPIGNEKKQIIPKESYGIKCMSMGFMVKDEEPIIWRGPMVMGVIKQFFQSVAWGELDFLVVDLPPGTGDAQLTMIQAVPIQGAVIVTTPQKVAVMDAVRGVEMFTKLGVRLLGIVENMSYLETPEGQHLYPFGQGGGESTAARYQIPLLAKVPLDERIRMGGDVGLPAALSEDNVSTHFTKVAQDIQSQLQQ